jgi:predicted nucleic acid-binding protein
MIESNISVITKMELLGWDNPSIENENNCIAFIADSTVFNLTDEIVDKTIALRKTYAKLALPDAIIAATALVHNLTLISRNDKDFQRIKKLKYTNPFNL